MVVWEWPIGIIALGLCFAGLLISNNLNSWLYIGLYRRYSLAISILFVLISGFCFGLTARL